MKQVLGLFGVILMVVGLYEMFGPASLIVTGAAILFEAKGIKQ